jgi:hypothetical protein
MININLLRTDIFTNNLYNSHTGTILLAENILSMEGWTAFMGETASSNYVLWRPKRFMTMEVPTINYKILKNHNNLLNFMLLYLENLFIYLSATYHIPSFKIFILKPLGLCRPVR